MGKTIGQLYSSDPASAIADANLFELEQSSNSKGGTFSQIWTWILAKSSGVFDTIPAGYTDNLLHRGYIDGLILSNDAGDVDHDIAIAVGSARDSTNVISLVLPSIITKQIDASWAAGTNAGGMDTGSVATSQTYYQYLIRKDSDASIDALFSLSATAPTMPAGYTYKRRIGTVLTDVASNIIGFVQTDNEFIFKTPIIDKADAAPASTNRIAYATSVPSNKPGIYSIRFYGPGAGALWADQEARPDSAATSTNNDIYLFVASGNTYSQIIKTILANTSKQIYLRASTTSSSTQIMTYGWIDDRGRNA
jgi:hypothetical protein